MDVLIRGGEVVDGTGEARRQADRDTRSALREVPKVGSPQDGSVKNKNRSAPWHARDV